MGLPSPHPAAAKPEHVGQAATPAAGLQAGPAAAAAKPERVGPAAGVICRRSLGEGGQAGLLFIGGQPQ